MNAAYRRLVRVGFHPLHAQRLAAAGFDVIDIVPIGWTVNDRVLLTPSDREPAAR